MTDTAFNVPSLTIGRYRMAFSPRHSGRLPEWLGSTWRGAFGHALKHSVCVTGMEQCRPCPIFMRCIHAWVFETPPGSEKGKMRKYPAAPHPYALLSGDGGNISKSDEIGLELRLFGKANEHHSILTAAIERAAWKGLGSERLSLAATEEPSTEIRRHTGMDSDLPPLPERVHICLQSPLRIRIKGKYPKPKELEFGDFFSVLLRRISMLATFHEDRPFSADFRSLVARAREIRWQESNLRFHSIKRFSSRQGKSIDMSGLVGTLTLCGEQARPFWPYLWLGQHTLTGRGCVMGLGQYSINNDNPPVARLV